MPVRFDGRNFIPACHQWPKQVVANSMHKQCVVAPDVAAAADSVGAHSVGRRSCKIGEHSVVICTVRGPHAPNQARVATAVPPQC